MLLQKDHLQAQVTQLDQAKDNAHKLEKEKAAAEEQLSSFSEDLEGVPLFRVHAESFVEPLWGRGRELDRGGVF